MQHDNKDIDKHLQNLENQSLPDLSKLDEHWQQMKTTLQPDSMPSKSKPAQVRKLFRLIVAAVLIGGMSLVAYKYIYWDETNRQQASGKINQPVINVLSKDSPVSKFDHNVILKDSPVSKFNHNVRLKGSPVIKFNTVKKDTVIILNSVVPEAQPKASLDKFFKQLEKQHQEFVINNKRDTLISGEDGTALLIPANTFDSNNEVVITLKEFYSYEDIITNKLTTCSDGKQLITGGMIHLIATINGKEVDIQPGKSIRWFVPDTTNSMDQMQLFTGTKEIKKQSHLYEDGRELRAFFNGGDTAADGTLEMVNWIAQPQYFSNNYLVTSVKVLDLKNEPLRSRQTKKGSVGTFIISDNPKITREELADELKEKYDYYKVKIKSRKKDNFFRRITSSFSPRRRIQSAGDVGDSAWVSDEVAKRYDLQATETVTYTQRGIGYTNGYAVKRTFQNINLNKLKERFSVDIRTLGWINCDRFYLDNRPKIDYYVDLKDTAANYYTLLVFDKLRSMMSGYTNGNKIIFHNVPEGLTAKVISVGIQNGKTVTAMENIQLSKQPLTGLKFEGTSPAAFKEDLSGFDK